jgi:hypothetical protein
MKTRLFLSLLVTFLVGCASDDPRYDSVKRKPTAEVAIFRGGQKPARSYKEISSFTFNGPSEDESKAEAQFIEKAKKMGANAIILEPKVSAGQGLVGFRIAETYLYKAIAVVFE